MLRDLKRDDWLRILGIPPERVPIALILRGTRNLKHHYERYRERLRNMLEVGSPNGLLEDIAIGDFAGASVGYASVYGAAMASEVAHLFGVLGTRLVLQTGCCGAWKNGITAGDLFIPTRAGCGEAAAHCYLGPKQVVTPSLKLDSAAEAFRRSSVPIHFGGIFTTAALFAEGSQEVARWAADGWDGVDLETATTVAVAEHFGMESAAILYVYDNPRDHGDIVHTDAAKAERRRLGDNAMIEATFATIRRYLKTRND